MKKLVTFGVLMMMALCVSAQPEEQGLRAPAHRKKAAKAEKPAPLQKEEAQGVIPRAVRGGNPLQMLNPFAPARYGKSQDSLAYNPFTGKFDQIKYFEIRF